MYFIYASLLQKDAQTVAISFECLICFENLEVIQMILRLSVQAPFCNKTYFHRMRFL